MEQLKSHDKVDWKRTLLDRLSILCGNTPFAHAFERSDVSVGIHLAVFIEPYLTFLLQGKKTVESRFSINKHAPFGQVQAGDILILKRSSGPVCGLCKIASVWFYRLDAKTWPEIERFSEALCMDGSAFWEKKRAASFATLMQIENVHALEEFDIGKEDPRSWVVVRRTQPLDQGALEWSP
jgi:hypothetical protein